MPIPRPRSQCSPLDPECKRSYGLARAPENALIDPVAIGRVAACGVACRGLSRQPGWEGVCGLMFTLPTETLAELPMGRAVEVSADILTGRVDPEEYLPGAQRAAERLRAE